MDEKVTLANGIEYCLLHSLGVAIYNNNVAETHFIDFNICWLLDDLSSSVMSIKLLKQKFELEKESNYDFDVLINSLVENKIIKIDKPL